MYKEIEATSKTDSNPLIINDEAYNNKKVYIDGFQHSIKQEINERVYMQEENRLYMLTDDGTLIYTDNNDFKVGLHFAEQEAEVGEVLNILKNVYIKQYLEKRSSGLYEKEKGNLSL